MKNVGQVSIYEIYINQKENLSCVTDNKLEGHNFVIKHFYPSIYLLVKAQSSQKQLMMELIEL